jgi:arginyl-tRNA synthetase
MSIVSSLQRSVTESLTQLFSKPFTESDFQVNQTKPEFEGDYTVVLFSLVKSLKLSPDEIGGKLGDRLVAGYPDMFCKYNIIKGFLNLTIPDEYWIGIIKKHSNDICFGKQPLNGKKVMVEYSSPNTNKPLHLGHLRNNFLGWSVAEILKASGYEVFKTCVVNDRGIHICKSMIAWQLYGNGETPESTGIKGDHFVGNYYVRFNDELKKQVEELNKNGVKDAEKEAPLMKATQLMLQDWEAGKPEVMKLWTMMNDWVYDGFEITYHNIGSDFDRMYYESNTYLLGKDIVEQGLEKGVFFRKDDGSIWIDLTAEGLDEKLVLRKDGTSVYITQDIGLAKQKHDEYHIDQSLYVIADEQNYHMKVLQLICKKLGLSFADGIHHLSYGMVELPTGKMKSREGTVVDADDIVMEMESVAEEKTKALGKVDDFSPEELKELFHTIGIGALKFFLLRIDPKKRMVFNPQESIDFHGFTGPFIQFNHARIKSVLRKANFDPSFEMGTGLLKLEKELTVMLEQYPDIIRQARIELNPSVVAIYVYNLARTFSSFYTEHSIANAENNEKRQLRLHLSVMCANVIRSAMKLLGIEVPERM